MNKLFRALAFVLLLVPGIAAADSAVIVNDLVVVASTGGNSGGNVSTGNASASASLYTEVNGATVECATLIQTNGSATVAVTVVANGETATCVEGGGGATSFTKPSGKPRLSGSGQAAGTYRRR